MNFFEVHISEQAKKYVSKCLESGWISEGEIVEQFEKALQSIGLKNPVTVNSGTSALHVALEAAEIGPGDEVIIPSQTFIATGLAVLMAGAKPVFADIDLSTGNFLVDSVRSMLTPQTRAIIPVHWGGYPCEMDELALIADENEIFILEDAAHALGAKYKGKPIGSLSRFTVFSFQAIKHCTTGDGGAVCCLNDNDVTAIRSMRWFGIDRNNSIPSILGERQFDVFRIGYKYHMNNIAAAMGLGNLETFNERLARRREIGHKYRQELRDVQGFKLLECRNENEHAFWLFSVLVDNREGFIRMMQEKEIPVSVVHQGIHKYSVFNEYRRELSNQIIFDQQHIALPVHSSLTHADVEYVIDAVKSGW